ncbi:UDP-2,4-diacetamido-2,4,6-trideoxy-beta-L-altropyranose hydrolase [Terrimonas pollutisoli]|uniref:UDP-2,4-diacetamido-2,4, 6-trideoxy-beta-L-altropyranose hydrolase n=1 Tax=Terrimonas pollutisoli TaxID=3034147 RepID=UPI0023EBFBF8|nr:UDP-2,4-diacetamido-2,4,6-trideoxy-beta-L-altropyranose hydrolase [Terrimonas sp. H1YJ31]
MKVYFRADGNSEMGLGHMVRCGALAEIIREDTRRILFTRCQLGPIVEEMREVFDEVIQLHEEISAQEELKQFTQAISPADLVVIDGYHFKGDYQQKIVDSGALLVCIDDIHTYPFKSSAIINSAGNIKPSDYDALPQTQFFLGPAYTLLRKSFLKKALKRQQRIENSSVFICLGGADPANATLDVLEFAIALNKFDQYFVVVGNGYRYFDELERYIAGKDDISVLKGLSAADLADTMAKCSYGICSPSTVCYEYMTVGGVVYLKQIADNQQDMIQYLVENGFSFLLENAGNTTKEQEEESLIRQMNVFDGKAGERLKSVFEKLFLSKQVNTRRVKKDDLMLCYEWANDPMVREQSFNSNAIPLAEHEQWFNSKLQDPYSFYYILELENNSFAQIRFQVSDSNAVLSYLIDKDYRNKGLGTTILSKGIEAFIKDFNTAIDIIGYVKFSNVASQRSFEKLNFEKQEAIEYDTSYKYVMHYDGNSNSK